MTSLRLVWVHLFPVLDHYNSRKVTSSLEMNSAASSLRHWLTVSYHIITNNRSCRPAVKKSPHFPLLLVNLVSSIKCPINLMILVNSQASVRPLGQHSFVIDRSQGKIGKYVYIYMVIGRPTRSYDAYLWC